MKKIYYIFLFILITFGLYAQDDCIIDAGLEVTPAPQPDPFISGFTTFPASTTVQFCYTVDEYNTPGTQNWMHGIVPLFGPGWDLSTLEPIGQPESQFDEDGEWIWTGNITTGITGEFISEPGWWFDAASGGGSLNGDPTDNWGDGNNGPWVFCWEITTNSCPPAFNEASLIVEVTNYADSESGSWANAAALTQCIDDPSYYLQGIQLDCPTCDESGLIVINPSCANVNETGGVVIITPAGTGPIWNYLWFNLSTGELIEEFNEVGDLPVTVSGLDAGEYLISVEDINFPGGCSAPVYFEILPPEDILIEFNIEDASCYDLNNGSISVSSVMNSNCINEELIAEDVNNDDVINNNDFSCQSTSSPVCGCDFVTYFNACQAENWYGLTNFDVGACPEENVNYEISWTSTNPISGSGEEINNLAFGDYQVSVESLDPSSPVFGCSFDTIISVSSPDQFVSNFVVDAVSCFEDINSDGINDITDGSISITLTGGTSDYNTFIGFTNGQILSNQSGDNLSFNNLAAGDYFFSSTDAFGCLLAGDEVFFSISEPTALVVESIMVSDYSGYGITCNGSLDGFINIDINGGTEPYSFNWFSTVGFNSNDVNISDIPSGIYSCIITDSNNCDIIVDNLIVSEPSGVIVLPTIESVSCSGASDGSISIDVSGAIPPYSFSWFSTGGFNSNDANIFNLSTGEYILTIIDGNNCQFQENFSVTTPNPIEVNLTLAGVTCFNANDGVLNVTATGGDGIYNYEWLMDGIFISNNQDLINISPAMYEVIITDSEGCFESTTIEVVEPELLIANIETFDVDCFGDNTGSADTFISGGTPPYTQNWSAGANPNNLFAGVYSVNIIDANNCSFTINDIVISQPSEPLFLTADIINVFPCNGDQTGSISPIAFGGVPPYQFFINGSLSFNLLGANTYTITVEDVNGCSLDTDFIVNEPSFVTASLNTIDASCSGLSDGQASAIPSGGSAPYIISWSAFGTGLTVDNNNLSAGVYVMSVEDINGCLYNESFVISEPDSSEMAIEIEPNLSCLEPFNVIISGFTGNGTGNWSANGPGSVSFSNQDSQTTTVTVSEYGNYEIIFTDGCGEEEISFFQMISLFPSASAVPSIVYCDFETTLQASSGSNEGYWTLLDAPDNTDVAFVNGVNSFSTPIIATNAGGGDECCYGEYLFSFTSCGKEDFVFVNFDKEAPEFGVSTFQDCALDAQIFIYNPISFTEALLSPGTWEASGENASDVTINYSTPHEINFSVSQFGFYDFRYFICDTFYQHSVGFSCPLQIPNAFTPNGDSNNDLFLGNGLIPSVHSQINFMVYNKWGQTVHAQSNYDYQNNLWDGTTNTFEDEELNDGVYYYVLELFNKASQRKERYSGYVHLFRG
jgi:gliding motility-associated-like protein